MEDPSHWSQFDSLPEEVKAIILDRFLEKYLGTLDAFKRLALEDQRKLMAELLKHNVSDMEQFKRMSPSQQDRFMRM